jgi:transposase
MKKSKHQTLPQSREGTKTEIVRPSQPIRRLEAHAAGLDIGAAEIAACVSDGEGNQIVRMFGTYTADLQALADWLAEHGAESIAMESTGVYWIPVFELLESRGFCCHLISSADIHRHPGRKSDVLDCQWIQTLHAHGLLADSFRPEADLIPLRTLLRHRAQLIEHRTPHIQHMQKALTQMNIQLKQALSDVTGETGLRIIRAIVAGERDPHKLAALRNYRCHKDEDEIARALTGTWRAEHLFVLKQSLAMYDSYTQQIEACDAEIERLYEKIRAQETEPQDEPPLPPLSKPSQTHSKNAPQNAENIRQHLYRIAGVDLLEIPGVSVSVGQTLLAEVGSDLHQFEDAKHFCSWLGLSPHNQITGGKVIASHRLKNRNRAGQALIHAAASNIRAQTQFGAFYRRLKGRIGESQALIATAHKIARVVYVMLKEKQPYHGLSAHEYEEQFRQRELRSLQRRASRLGLTLVPAAHAAVS